MLCIFNTFTRKCFHFAHVMLIMLSSTYHFWGVHNLYQAISAKLNIWEQGKVGLFFLFHYSFFLFIFRYSFFTFGFSLFVFHIRFSIFVFWFPLFVFRFLTYKIGQSTYPIFSYHILTFDMRPNIVFLHSKSYFDIWIGTKYCISTFKILFWNSKSGQISYFNIQNTILTFKLRPNIVFWHSKSYFDIRNRAEYRILTFKILFWHLNWGQISYFNIQIPILTFKLRLNIIFWHSNSYFDIRNWPEYRILTF